MKINRVKKQITAALLVGVMAFTTPLTSLAWDSKNNHELDTHKLITQQALAILEKDMVDTENQQIIEGLKLMKDHIKDLKWGSVYPDFEGKSYSLFQDHYYEPFKNINYTKSWWYPGPVVEITARDRVLLLTGEAQRLWQEGDYQQAIFKLGCALHFFEDLTQPHHTSTRLECMGIQGTVHGKFERWVEETKQDYVIETAGSSTREYAYGDMEHYDNLTSFLINECYIRAATVNQYVPITKLTSSWDQWKTSATKSLEQAQIGTARVLYAFLKEVTSEW